MKLFDIVVYVTSVPLLVLEFFLTKKQLDKLWKEQHDRMLRGKKAWRTSPFPKDINKRSFL